MYNGRITMKEKKWFNFLIDQETITMIDDLLERGCNIAKLLRNAIRSEWKKLVEPELKKDN